MPVLPEVDSTIVVRAGSISPWPRRRRSWRRRCGPSRCRRGCRPRAWPPAPRRSPAPPGRAGPSACRRRCRPGWRARFARPVKLASPDCNRRFSPPGHGYAILRAGLARQTSPGGFRVRTALSYARDRPSGSRRCGTSASCPNLRRRQSSTARGAHPTCRTRRTRDAARASRAPRDGGGRASGGRRTPHRRVERSHWSHRWSARPALRSVEGCVPCRRTDLAARAGNAPARRAKAVQTHHWLTW